MKTPAHRPGVVAFIAVVTLALAASPGRAETYRVDGFEDGQLAGFQAGFIANEMAAVCFNPPEDHYPIRLGAMQILYGSASEGVTLEVDLKLWTSGGNGNPPSELERDFIDIEVTSSINRFNEFDLTAEGISVDQPWCVGIAFRRDGLPSIARDNDGTIDSGNNWIWAIDPITGASHGWRQSSSLGLTGDWIIRTIGTPSGSGPSPDAGGVDTGDADTGVPPDSGEGGPDADDGPPRIDLVEQDGDNPSNDILVTLTGRGFRPSYRYRVGPEPLDGIDVLDDGDTATGTLEGGALEAGVYSVVVSGDFGEVAYTDGVVLRDAELPPITVRSVTPNETDLGESQDIVIIGDNFVDNMTVTLGGRPLPSAALDGPTTLRSFVPGDLFDSAGAYDLVVRGPDGREGRLAQAFEFLSKGGDGGCGCAVSAGPRSGFVALLTAVGALLLRRRKR